MIGLEVEDYCQNCPEFNVEVEALSYADGFGEEIFHHTVRCKHAKRCEHIKEYLEGQK